MATIFIKTIIISLFVLLAVRLMGKREIGQLQPVELVVIIIIADVASVPMEEVGTPILQGIIPIFALVVGQLILSYLNIKSVFLHKLISGKSSVLISKGKIVQENLKRQRYTIDGLMEQMRVAGYSDIRDIEYAILETSGQVTVIQKPNKRTTTPEDFNIEPDYEGLPYDLVIDGKVLNENLRKIGKNEIWLKKQVEKFNMTPQEALIVTFDGKGQIFCQKKER